MKNYEMGSWPSGIFEPNRRGIAEPKNVDVKQVVHIRGKSNTEDAAIYGVLGDCCEMAKLGEDQTAKMVSHPFRTYVTVFRPCYPWNAGTSNPALPMVSVGDESLHPFGITGC